MKRKASRILRYYSQFCAGASMALPISVMLAPSGGFTLTTVPSSTYELDVWQDKTGTKSQPVAVQAGKIDTAAFTLGSELCIIYLAEG